MHIERPDWRHTLLRLSRKDNCRSHSIISSYSHSTNVSGKEADAEIVINKKIPMNTKICLFCVSFEVQSANCDIARPLRGSYG